MKLFTIVVPATILLPSLITACSSDSIRPLHPAIYEQHPFILTVPENEYNYPRLETQLKNSLKTVKLAKPTVLNNGLFGSDSEESDKEQLLELAKSESQPEPNTPKTPGMTELNWSTKNFQSYCYDTDHRVTNELLTRTAYLALSPQFKSKPKIVVQKKAWPWVINKKSINDFGHTANQDEQNQITNPTTAQLPDKIWEHKSESLIQKRAL
jgi:hypothetical protein